MQCCCIRWTEATAWCEGYDNVQSCAVMLLYFQVACALVGSLGAAYTGLLLANLALALFALVAIESGSQSLGRAYAGLLAFALLLDIIWFILFTSETRNFSDVSGLGKFGAFSVKLVFWMQVTGCVLRVISSSLWIQMYRLGAAIDTADLYLPIDFDNRIGNFSSLNPGSPSPAVNTRTMSMSDEVLGGSIYNPAVYSSILQSFNEDTYFGMESPPRLSDGPTARIAPAVPRSFSGKASCRFGKFNIQLKKVLRALKHPATSL